MLCVHPQPAPLALQPLLDVSEEAQIRHLRTRALDAELSAKRRERELATLIQLRSKARSSLYLFDEAAARAAKAEQRSKRKRQHEKSLELKFLLTLKSPSPPQSPEPTPSEPAEAVAEDEKVKVVDAVGPVPAPPELPLAPPPTPVHTRRHTRSTKSPPVVTHRVSPAMPPPANSIPLRSHTVITSPAQLVARMIFRRREPTRPLSGRTPPICPGTPRPYVRSCLSRPVLDLA
ncbi:hypothetical protein BOTBODRAFT_29124 [Botryobasidium botryosum FD-172 SS1]|uniref:Uncharacterized protein n=1 Tax=Botryobasidium botryosum (strain FD-172 SS1) TaxID=930990 RepID=A0A067MT00_BOTB1|nr:hypothetical protein BOTBODRAFT_29124 [Botryobasidium botryosum FD-172 SS1]